MAELGISFPFGNTSGGDSGNQNTSVKINKLALIRTGGPFAANTPLDINDPGVGWSSFGGPILIPGPQEFVGQVQTYRNGVLQLPGENSSGELDVRFVTAFGTIAFENTIQTNDVVQVWQLTTASGVAGSRVASGGTQILSFSFMNQTFVDFTHNFNTTNYLTTVLDSSGEVLGSNIVQKINTVEVSFNSPQSGTIIVISAAPVNAIRSQTFTGQTQVILTHSFGTINYLTTILDAAGRVLDAEIVQGSDNVQVNFNSPQSGVVIVIGLPV